MELIIFIIIVISVVSSNKKKKSKDYGNTYLDKNRKKQTFDWKKIIPDDSENQISQGLEEIGSAFSGLLDKMSSKKKHQTPEEYQREDHLRRQRAREEQRQREYEEQRRQSYELEKKKEELRRRKAEKEARLAEQKDRQKDHLEREAKKQARLAEERMRQQEREAEARFADCTVHSYHSETDPVIEKAAAPTVPFCLEDYLFPTTASFYPGNEKKETESSFKLEDYLFPTTASFYPKSDVPGL